MQTETCMALGYRATDHCGVFQELQHLTIYATVSFHIPHTLSSRSLSGLGSGWCLQPRSSKRYAQHARNQEPRSLGPRHQRRVLFAVIATQWRRETGLVKRQRIGSQNTGRQALSTSNSVQQRPVTFQVQPSIEGRFVLVVPQWRTLGVALWASRFGRRAFGRKTPV